MVRLKRYAKGLKILIINGKRLCFINDCSSIDQFNKQEEDLFNEI